MYNPFVGLESDPLSYDREKKFLYKNAMLKSFFLTILLFVASTLLITEATLRSSLPQRTQLTEVSLSSQLLAQGIELPEAANDDADVSDRPDQPADDKTTEFDRSRERSSLTSAPPNASQPPAAYDMEAIKAFDDELFGP